MAQTKNPYYRIVLIGFRGTGKTTVGKKLSESLNWSYISTDALIEQKSRMRISEFVKEKGWSAFRKIERQVIKKLQNQKKMIFDCGGGVVEDSQIMSILIQNSLLVWIDAEIKDIYKRISKNGHRPLLNQPDLYRDIEANYSRRLPLYRCYGRLHVNTSKDSIKNICQYILEELETK